MNARRTAAPATDIWAPSVGQEEAVALLQHAITSPVHAYLFLGPAGTGKRRTARAFAAALLCEHNGCGMCRTCTLALTGEHPDVTEVEREGAAISRAQADQIIRTASMSPMEGLRKVLILDEFHLLHAEAAARLLKTVEEPPAGTVFCVLADQLVPDLVTIASRCVRVPFHSVPDDAVIAALRSEGVDEATAVESARVAAGDLDRARLLSSDPGLFTRRAAFATVPQRLNGTGNRVMQLCDELLRLIDDAADPLRKRHEDEAAELEARLAQPGERKSSRKPLEERHKRELRRHRTDELRAGLGAIASTYRDRLVQGVEGRRGLEEADAVDRIMHAIEHLDRNPNEPLMLQGLLLTLPPLS